MKLTQKNATILLAFVISARATSFMFSKLCLTTMSAFSLIALRFTLASVLMFALFFKKIIPAVNKRNVLSGMAIGTLFFFVLFFEHTGLKTTNASTTSFIENLSIIIVPFMEWLFTKKTPSLKVFISAFFAVAGVACLTMTGNRIVFTVGEVFIFCAALFYASAIIVTSKLAPKGDPFVIGFFQITTTGALAWVSVLVSGDFTAPSASYQAVMIVLLAVVCTSFGFTLQPVAQSKLSAETAGAFCALGPLVASIMSFVFLKEDFSLSTLFGALFILLALSIESGLIKLPVFCGFLQSKIK